MATHIYAYSTRSHTFIICVSHFQSILSGFAGATADAMTLRTRLERKIEEHPGTSHTRLCPAHSRTGTKHPLPSTFFQGKNKLSLLGALCVCVCVCVSGQLKRSCVELAALWRTDK